MKNTLSYGARLDWGNKTLPPKYVKPYGIVVLLLTCLYLWIFHKHNASTLCQTSAAALAVALIMGRIAFSLMSIIRDCNQFWVTFEASQGQVNSIALRRVELSFDHAKGQLKLETASL